MSQSLLILNNLACERGGRTLFRGLNLELQAGRCVEVRGPNGSGKSTLLRLAAGLYP
ncbi:MAG: ATP-binding cassette domain-containing protein, partial [Gammaproteobacteria bacterium]|nr:ATP-binding cassette domain-containing protein [Gammaproteobacteria bacterium]